MLRTQSISVKNANKSKLKQSKETKTKLSNKKFDTSGKSKTAESNHKSNGIKNGVKSTENNLEKVDTIKLSHSSSSSSATPPVNIPLRKLERANSFFLTRKLTNLYNSLTSSKESLNKIPENDDHNNKNEMRPPYKFGRSVSLATITLRKDYRNSIRKPKLEQLSEEDHHIHGGHHHHRHTISESYQNHKNMSTASIDSVGSRSSEKSFSLMSSLKRTFSLTPAKRKQATNPKWNASLLSLQQIDVMISYEDLSYINYDKFNTYEETLLKNLSQSDLKTDNRRQSASLKSNVNEQRHRTNSEQPSESYFSRYPSVKRRSRPNPMITGRRHSTYTQSAFISSEIEINSIANDDESKRWSNPCFSLSTSNIENSCYPSYASIVKTEQNSDENVDEVDCANHSNSEANDFEIASLRKAQSADSIYMRCTQPESYCGAAVSPVYPYWLRCSLCVASKTWTNKKSYFSLAFDTFGSWRAQRFRLMAVHFTPRVWVVFFPRSRWFIESMKQ